MSTYLTQKWRAERKRLNKPRRCHMAQVEGSALVAQAIRREGIEVLFGLAGGPIQDIMGCAPHCGVRPIGVHHEQAATFAAAAYGYVKNQVGVAVLAAGPGVTNGVTGAHVAYDNCWPLLILGGSGPQKGRGTGTFQETENVPMGCLVNSIFMPRGVPAPGTWQLCRKFCFRGREEAVAPVGGGIK